jgi:hypothetical protein
MAYDENIAELKKRKLHYVVADLSRCGHPIATALDGRGEKRG